MSAIGVILVCYGNICRSPIAEVLLQKEIADRGLEEKYRVLSAGFWMPDQPAHPFSIQCMKRRGLDLLEHRSRLLTPMLIGQTHLILAMEEQLAERARNLGAEHAYNIAPYATLGVDTEAVSDPIGQDLPTFEKCSLRLEALIPRALDRMEKESF
jgi:protein-tyrosine phosphatase